MDDLVKRLRVVTGFIRFETGDRVAAAACLSEEAADRIEALQAENARLQDALENLTIAIGMGWDLDGVVDVARAALEANPVADK